MSEGEELVPRIHRILVAVDASQHSRAALEAAVEIAARFEAELLGLFVEDIDMLRAVGLPFSWELGQYSAQRRRIDLGKIERHLRARARQIQTLFRALASRRAVSGVFRVARGTVETEILSAAQDADVLVIGRAGWSQTHERRLGSTAKAACNRPTSGITVVMHAGTRLASPFLIVYDGSPVSNQALAIAGALAERTRGLLQVLLVADGDEESAALRANANSVLRRFRVQPRYHRLALLNLPLLVQAVRTLRCRSLVLPTRLPPLSEGDILGLVEALDVPVLLVHQTAEPGTG